MLFTHIVCLSYLGSDILNLETVQRWETDILQRRDGLEQMSKKKNFLDFNLYPVCSYTGVGLYSVYRYTGVGLYPVYRYTGVGLYPVYRLSLIHI